MKSIDLGKALASLEAERDDAALRGDLKSSGALTMAIRVIVSLVDDRKRLMEQNGAAKPAAEETGAKQEGTHA